MTTRAPGTGGVCDTTSTGTAINYAYDAAGREKDTGFAYDAFGRTTSVPAGYAGGTGKAISATSYFANDLVRSITQNNQTRTYALDPGMRPKTRTAVDSGTTTTQTFHYADDSDSPDWTDDGATNYTRNVTGPDGDVVGTVVNGTGTLQLTDLRGSVVATASLSTTATALSSKGDSDEFGVPRTSVSARYGWLGGKRRLTDTSAGVVEMGVRVYVPQMGRFLQTDPVDGGSANDYDYANQDPVNGLDLDGRRACRASMSFNGSGAYEGTSTLVELNARATVACTRRARDIHVRIRFTGGHVGGFSPIYPSAGSSNTCHGLEPGCSVSTPTSVEVTPGPQCGETYVGYFDYEISYSYRRGSRTVRSTRGGRRRFRVTAQCEVY